VGASPQGKLVSAYTKLIVYFIIRLIGRANARSPYTNKVSLRRLKKFNGLRRVSRYAHATRTSVLIALLTAQSN